MENALRSLRDIDGVLGSFLVDENGQLLARDMPGIFDEHTLRAASQRLSQLRAAFETDGQPFEGCTARFGGHLLVLRSAAQRTLCVLCPVGTNMTTLQMGLNLVARRANELPERASLPLATARNHTLPPPTSLPPRTSLYPAAPSAALQSSPPSFSLPLDPPPSSDATSEPQSTTRFFRGRPVP
ncbi:MAG TPA: roadblock/LC7 domain-containing protein [Polyangiales bacterium]